LAKSTARKLRDKQVREGKLNPEMLRSPFAKADLRTRMTKSKQERLNSSKHKNLLLRGPGDDSFFVLKIQA
jgi:hypothetical protein